MLGNPSGSQQKLASKQRRHQNNQEKQKNVKEIQNRNYRKYYKSNSKYSLKSK